MRLGLRRSKRFTPPIRFSELRKKAKDLISLGHQTGELAAGRRNGRIAGIGCVQHPVHAAFRLPAQPHHRQRIVEGIEETLPEANIAAVDYDPAGASEVNQINRIKLMMSMAK